MRVFIAGGGGTLGLALARRLVCDRHEVVAATLTSRRHAQIRARGAQPVHCDAFNREALRAAITTSRPDVVVNQLTALPAHIDPRRIRAQLAATNRLRGEGGRNLAEAATAAGVRRLVAQSVAFAYRPDGRGPRPESADLDDQAPGGFADSVRAIKELEDAVLGMPRTSGIVLRYGYLYGRGTHFDVRSGSIVQSLRRRLLPIVGSGEGVWSFIHLEDAVNATAVAISDAAAGVFNIVDDDPAPAHRWIPYLAQQIGAARPLRIPTWLARLVAGEYGVYTMTQMPGATNGKAGERLGWRPRFGTWAVGFEHEMSELRREEGES